MKISTAQFMRECVANPTIYVGTNYNKLDKKDLQTAIKWDVVKNAPKRKAIKKSYGLDFIREDGGRSRFDSAYTNVETFNVKGYKVFRVACLKHDNSSEAWNYIYYIL